MMATSTTKPIWVSRRRSPSGNGLRRTASARRNTSWPPSRIGIGRTLRMARLMDRKAMKPRKVAGGPRRPGGGGGGPPPPHLDRDRVRGVATRHAREVLPRYHRVTVDLEDAVTRHEARLGARTAGRHAGDGRLEVRAEREHHGD